jgi:hypothetical protein
MRLHARLRCPRLFAGPSLAACLSQTAHADLVTITLTGTVTSGTDGTGVFGFPKKRPFGRTALYVHVHIRRYRGNRSPLRSRTS